MIDNDLLEEFIEESTEESIEESSEESISESFDYDRLETIVQSDNFHFDSPLDVLDIVPVILLFIVAIFIFYLDVKE